MPIRVDRVDGFNSTMVRLKALRVDGLATAPVFQFHYGSIKGASCKSVHF